MKRRQFITLIGGAAAAWPFAARAQQRSSPPTQIGFLPMGSPTNSADLSLVEAFRKGINDAGLLEGRDVIVDVAWGGNESEYTKNIIELIRRGTAILATAGSSASSVAKRQTSTIPIVARSTNLPDKSATASLNPVTLPLGRARLSTNPIPIGLPTLTKTIGIVEV